MPGLEELLKQTQPITGPASLDVVAAALSPQDQALAAAGIDPFGGDQGMLQGQAGMAQGGMQGAIPQQAPMLSPETRMAISAQLQQSLMALGQPTNEADAMAAQNIQSALMALGGGQ